MKRRLLLTFLIVGVGGAFGTLFRYVINIQTVDLLFPFGTLLENLLGSLILGLITGYLVHKKVNELWRTGLGVGFCGGFTTMSTLSADFFSLFATSQINAITYLGVSLFGGVTLAFVGYILGGKLGYHYQLTKKAGEAK